MLLCSILYIRMLCNVLLSGTCSSTTQSVGLRDYTLPDFCTFTHLTAAVQRLMLPELTVPVLPSAVILLVLRHAYV